MTGDLANQDQGSSFFQVMSDEGMAKVVNGGILDSSDLEIALKGCSDIPY